MNLIVFDDGLEDIVAEQEGVSGKIRTTTQVRTRFLPSVQFSVMGNRKECHILENRWEVQAMTLYFTIAKWSRFH